MHHNKHYNFLTLHYEASPACDKMLQSNLDHNKHYNRSAHFIISINRILQSNLDHNKHYNAIISNGYLPGFESCRATSITTSTTTQKITRIGVLFIRALPDHPPLMVLLDIPFNLLFEVLMLLVAAYAAILSTINYFLKTKPKIQVSLSFGVPLAGKLANRGCYFLKAANVGVVTTTLTGANIVVPGKSRGDALKLSLPRFLLIPLLKIRLLRREGGIHVPLIFGPHDNIDPFPCTLEPGKSYEMWTPVDTLARNLTDKNLGRDFWKLVKNPEDIEDSVYSGKIKIKGEYSDMASRSYKSGWVDIDLDRWIRA
jgi:hypothetical protein